MIVFVVVVVVVVVFLPVGASWGVTATFWNFDPEQSGLFIVCQSLVLRNDSL